MAMNDASVAKLLRTGERVKFIVEGYNELFVSRIEAIDHGGEIALGTPVLEDNLLELKEGTKVTIQLIGPDALYRIHTKVLHQGRMDDRVDATVLSNPEEVNRIQRRKYVRVTTDLKLDLQLNPDDAVKYPDFHVISNRKPNISGGGIFLVTSSPLPPDTLVRMVLHVSPGDAEARPITTLAKVTWVDTSHEDKGHYGLGFEFHNTATKDREKIIHFVFNLLRDQMKKGLP